MRREEFEKEYRKNIEEIPLPDILKKITDVSRV